MTKHWPRRWEFGLLAATAEEVAVVAKNTELSFLGPFFCLEAEGCLEFRVGEREGGREQWGFQIIQGWAGGPYWTGDSSENEGLRSGKGE